MGEPKTPLLLNALADDNTASHEEALLRIYQRLRPGNPPQLEKAKALFHEKFYDTNRYRLGRVGRFRINRKLGLNIPETEMTLRPDDLIAAIRYLVQLRNGEPDAEIDDIDHLGNRRLRTIDELAADELRKGFLEAAANGPGADEPERPRGHDAAKPGQSEEHFGGHRVFLRPRRAFAGGRPDQPACRCSRTSGGFRPWAPAA